MFAGSTGRGSVWILGALLVGAACKPEPPVDPPPPPPWVEIEAAQVRPHVEFLADDAQQGRAPGSEADARVQAYIEQVMRDGGLQPAFEGAYRQTFEITDGVRIDDGGDVLLEVAGASIPPHILPFSSNTSQRGPVAAQMLFVGHGIPRGGKGTGDYEGLEKEVQGRIVVALHGGPDDPHLSAADTRPQSKVIAARDHGAAGFVLWDPYTEVAFPNHGAVNDLRVPAVAVGFEGTPALLEALLGKKKAASATSGSRFDIEASGLKPGRKSKKTATLRTEVSPVRLSTANVAGVLPGDGSTDKIVVVGAHMDHLGLGTSHSLAPGERAVHNGADDNASGVAVMLETCEALATVPVHERPYDLMCVAFGAEEMGLLGSKHFVETLDPAVRGRIVAMLNFDMVGRLTEDGVIVAGVGTSSVWPDLIDETRGDLRVKSSEDGYGPSDHGSFYEQKIPVLHFFTGPHEDYHKPSDDIEKIDFEGAAGVGTMAYRIVRSLMADEVEPDYRETERPQPRRGGFKVSLGTIPDYAAEVDGVRLSGVRKGGPADKAGLQKGDVIKQLGQREIHNLDDYMAAFAVMNPGETVKVVVERQGERVELEMVPGAPR